MAEWHRTSATPALVVRFNTHDEEVFMSLNVQGRTMNFSRKRSDPIENVLKRMKLNVSKTMTTPGQPNDQKRQKTPVDPDSVQMSFYDSQGSEMSATNMLLEEVISIAKNIRLNGIFYSLVLNPPRPKSVAIFHPIVSDCPVFIRADVESGTLSDLSYEYVSTSKVSHDPVLYLKEAEQVSLKLYNPEYQEFEITTSVSPPVLPHPEPLPCSILHKLPPSPKGTLRLGTWNILAQAYVSTELAADVMYAHVAKDQHEKLLSFSYRNGLIFRDLINFQSDLLLLQEATPDSVELCVNPLLKLKHMTARFDTTETTNPDDLIASDVICAFKDNSSRPNGVVIVSNRDKLELIESHNILLSGNTLWDNFTSEETLIIRKSFGDHFMDIAVPNLKTVACLGVYRLKNKDNQQTTLIVANTHLFYHPLGSHVRLLQTIALTRQVESLMERFPGSQVVLGGDLNSCINTGVVRYLMTGKVCNDDADWINGSVFKWGYDDDTEHIEGVLEEVGEQVEPGCSSVTSQAELAPPTQTRGINASHELNLTWTYGSNPPSLTHATSTFRDVLDYLFISQSGLEVTNSFENLRLSDEVVDQHGGLPNASFGSDHLLIGAEVMIRQSFP